MSDIDQFEVSDEEWERIRRCEYDGRSRHAAEALDAIDARLLCMRDELIHIGAMLEDIAKSLRTLVDAR